MGWRRYLPRLMGPEEHSTLYICFVFVSRFMKRGFCIKCIVPQCFWPLGPEDTLFVVRLGTMHHMIDIIHMDLIVASALYCLLEQVSRPLTQGWIARAINDEWIPASFRYIGDF